MMDNPSEDLRGSVKTVDFYFDPAWSSAFHSGSVAD